MLGYLRQLQTERDSLTQAATAIAESAATESRDVTEAERSSILTMGERCAVIDGQIQTFSEQLDSQRRYAQLRSALDEAGADEAPGRPLPAVRGTHNDVPANRQGWGGRFIDSMEFRSYDGRGHSGRVEVPGLFERAAIDTADPFGNNTFPYVYNQAAPSITTPMLDVCGHVTTNQLSVQWLEQPGSWPAAAKVAEGGLKPEAAFAVTPQTGTLATYAHWRAITRQALADIPQIQSIVERYLRGGIAQALEADVVAGLAAATLPSVPAVTGTDDALSVIRAGIGTVQANGFPNANTVALNPTDWAGLDVAVMERTNSGPTSAGNFWGLKPVPVPSIPAGTYYVGDFNAGVTIFENGAASVYMSDSHADFFIRNTLVVLAETMALPLVTQPAALVEIVFAAGP